MQYKIILVEQQFGADIDRGMPGIEDLHCIATIEFCSRRVGHI